MQLLCWIYTDIYDGFWERNRSFFTILYILFICWLVLGAFWSYLNYIFNKLKRGFELFILIKPINQWMILLYHNAGALDREPERHQNARPFGSSMAERQRFGCLDTLPCNCKQITSLWFSIWALEKWWCHWTERQPASAPATPANDVFCSKKGFVIELW